MSYFSSCPCPNAAGGGGGSEQKVPELDRRAGSLLADGSEEAQPHETELEAGSWRWTSRARDHHAGLMPRGPRQRGDSEAEQEVDEGGPGHKAPSPEALGPLGWDLPLAEN